MTRISLRSKSDRINVNEIARNSGAVAIRRRRGRASRQPALGAAQGDRRLEKGLDAGRNNFMQEFSPLDGALLIDKPAGPTSHDVVAAIRRRSN